MDTPPKTSPSLSVLAIRRHIATLTLTVMVVVLGCFVILRLPVDLLPSITYPRIGLRMVAPGLAPEVAVDEITRPLEEALSATEGVTQVFSRTREGNISIDLFFQPGDDIDQALNDATATLNRARDSLPRTAEQPRLFRIDPSQLPVYEMALTSPSLPPVDLRIFAEDELGRELLRVPGVANVDVSGGVDEEVQVQIDLQRLQAVGLELSDVLDALAERNQDTSGGRLRGGETESLTRVMGRFQTAEEIGNVAIEVSQSTPPRQVYLRDIATIVDGTEEQRVFVTLNGQPAVKVSIQKQAEANTIAVVDGVKAKLEALRQSELIPPEMGMTPTLDESRFIRTSIENVTIAGLSGALLAAVAVLLFLGSLRQTLIIVVAIPLASLVALILMGLFGLSLNVFSLGGLALGVGMVVDNSIVMLENIAKAFQPRAQSSEDRGVPSGGNTVFPPPRLFEIHGTRGRISRRWALQQTEASSQELESAILASTTTNLVSVLPFLLLGGFIALLFNELILTISFAVGASLVVALTVVPAMASRVLLWPGSSGLQQWFPIRFFQEGLAGITMRYQRSLSWILHHRIAAIAVTVLLFGGMSLWLGGQLPQEILPRINTGQAQVSVQFPPGTTIAANREVMAAVDRLILAQPETAYAFTTAGGSLFGNSTSENTLRASSTVTLKPGSEISRFVDRLEQELEQLHLIDTVIRVRPETVRGLILSNSPVRAEIDVGLQGNDPALLEKAGRQVIAALNRHATQARFRPDAEVPQEEIQIRPDWERVADLGLTAEAIGETLQTALTGTVPTQLQRGDRLVDIRVQLPPGSVQRPDQLREIPLFTNDRQLVRLGDVVTIARGRAPGEIQRLNQRPVLLIAGNLKEGASLSRALAEVEAIVSDLDLPEGVTLMPSASADTNRQIQDSLITLGGLATFLVFVVMAVQYNSLIDPLVILLTVPLALGGGILGLYVTGTKVGATVIVGGILLVGIVVNNAIIMVELANQIRASDRVSYQSAILQAAPQRLRPILMTTITTVLGLFPLALGIGEGAEFLQPLGVVVFSGLSLATLLTLFLIPCFYTLLHDLFAIRRRRVTAVWSGARKLF